MQQIEHTKVAFNQDAIEKLMEGVKDVCEATSTTLGPRGRNVAIERPYMNLIVHDGVTVADSIQPKDPFQRLGAQIIQEAAKKQRDEVGDGTTAVMVLAYAILKEAIKATASGVNPMSLRKGLESGSKKIIEALQALSQPIKGLPQMKQIATISAGDKELGELVAETLHKIGHEGIITVDESKLAETLVEIQDGMQIDKGYSHPLMITDPERRIAVLDDCHILVTDIPLTNLADIGKFLETKIIPNTKKVLFISPEISGDFLSALIGAKIQGAFLGLAVRAPGVAMHQRDMLQDICALTGAKFIDKESNTNFDKFDMEVLGKVEKVTAGKISTVIIGGQGHRKDVLARIQGIKTQMLEPDLSGFDKEQLRERLGKLTNGIAVIKVGGQTEIEMKERKERAIDAVAATQAAVKYGVIAGGEISYLQASQKVDWSDELGEKILKEAIRQPFKRLVENAGYSGGEMITELKHQKDGIGFDVTDGEFKDMIVSGIVDPVSVATSAIKTAVSVSVQLSSLGAAVVQEPQEKK